MTPHPVKASTTTVEINADTRRTSRSGDCNILGSFMCSILSPPQRYGQGRRATTGEGPPIEGPGGPLVDLCAPYRRAPHPTRPWGSAAGTATTPTTPAARAVVDAVPRSAPKSKPVERRTFLRLVRTWE